jgi:MFS family permease
VRLPPTDRGLLWILALGRLIGAAGAIEAMAFFTIYLRDEYRLPLAAVGGIAGLFSVGAVAGTFLAGFAADRLGRRPALLLTMACEALSLATLAFAHDAVVASALGVVVGVTDGALWPTYGASIADILPPAERQGGFALLTAAVNAGAAVGPAVGGFLLALGFPALFLTAGAGVALAMVALALRLPETRPPRQGTGDVRRPADATGDGEAPEEGEEDRGGYRVVARDRDIVAFLLLLLPPLTAMGLLITFFPLAAATTPGVGPRLFGVLFAVWGALIAVFQLPVTRLLARVRPVRAITWGYAALALAFVPIALWPGLAGYSLAIVGLALGEMLTSPPTGTLVANLAPVSARARYQSTIGLVWSAGGVLGPALAGLVYGRVGHAPFWLAAAVVAAVPVPLFGLWSRRERVRRAESAAVGGAAAAP